MKKLPIGIQTFSELIKENYVYVDKTEQVYQLIQGKYYFLSRPRRFGKSLLCTTLKALFEGRQELFKDLWIGKNSDHDWKKYPIIHIDFNLIDHETPERLSAGLIRALQEIASIYQIILPQSNVPGNLLQDLTNLLFKKYENKVVLLIDEYDKAILRHITDTPLATKMRETLKSFYEPIKGLDEKLRFVFITGVSKFSKTSIFSGLNNLEDLTVNQQGATLLGCTEDEIRQFFPEHLEHVSKKLAISLDDLIGQMRDWYNGYCFFINKINKQHTAVYNPFSILSFFKNCDFSNYWFETGTPTFLINLIKANDYPVQTYEHVEMTEVEFGNFEIEKISLNTLLFQTGYLTIKDYNTLTKNYVLTYPNQETSHSLISHIFASLTATSPAQLNTTAAYLNQAFKKNKLDDIKEILTKLYVTIPYTIQIGFEKYYQTIFFIALKFAGAQPLVEQATSTGRVDLVLQTATHCFIIEFKYKDTAAAALKQIKQKKYYDFYRDTGKKIVLVGIGFNEELRNVAGVQWEELI